MTEGTFETFYPFQAGVGEASPLTNFESGYFMPFYLESSLEGDDDSKDDQESIEYENEEAEIDIRDKCPFLEFRGYVREKKRELKAQYGKGKFTVFECGIKPSRIDPKYNPIVKIPKLYSPFTGCGLNPDIRPEYIPMICLWNCSKHPDKNCCVTNRNKHNNKVAAWADFRACQENQGKVINPGTENEEAYDRATGRWNDDMAGWHRCKAEHPDIWTPGWRKEWRKFKKAGGLNQLKDKCRGIVPPGPPPPPPPPTGPVDSGLDCIGLRNAYGILATGNWGSAEGNKDVINEFIRKGCKGPLEERREREAVEATPPRGRAGKGTVQVDVVPADETKNKKMMIIGAIVVVVIIALALVVRAMRSKGK